MLIQNRPKSDEFGKWDNCNFDPGFNSSLLKDGDKYKVILICPECGTRYDVGWRIEI